MRRLFPIVLLLSCVFFCSCGLKKLVLPGPPAQPGDELFLQAEELFRSQSYDQALEVYHTYLSQFPQGHLAPKALMNMADIEIILGNIPESRRLYDRLIEEYSDSPLVPDAQIAFIVTYYHEGDYPETVRRSNELLKVLVSSRHLVQIYTLLGNAYKAMSLPVDAINAYVKAFQHTASAEKEENLHKLVVEIEQLTSSDILFLLEDVEETNLRGYLLYQLGKNYIKEERIGKAEKTLNEFIENYPEHERVSLAKNLLLELKKESIYDHHTIGCLLPLSGRYQAFGDRALKGIELALARFHSSDTSNPTQFRLIIKDSGSTPEEAIQGVSELIEEKVAAIIGPLFSAESAILEAQKENIPIITMVQQQGITDLGDYVFRNFLTPRMQVETIVSYAVKNLGLRKFAILFPDENYGKTLMKIFWDEIIQKKATIVGVESYSPDMMDFTEPIKKLIGQHYPVPEDLRENDNPFTCPSESLVLSDSEAPPLAGEIHEKTESSQDSRDLLALPLEENTEEKSDEEFVPCIDFEAIFIPDAPKKVGLIIPQLSFFDVKDVYLFGTNLWHSDRLIEMAREYVQGAVLTEGFFSQSPSKVVKDFVTSFVGIYRETPEFIEAVAYDSAVMLFQTIHRSNILYRQTLRNELMNIKDFQGVTGISSVDHNRDVQKKLFLLRIQGKKFVEINPEFSEVAEKGMPQTKFSK